MTISNTSVPRYRPHPDQFHWELRNFFCHFLVKEQAFADARERLVPLWRELLSQYQELAPDTPFNHLPKPAAPNDALDIYLAALSAEVSDHLRCREHGEAVEWVCHALHAAVNDLSSIDAGMAPQHYFWHGTLQVPVLSAGTAMVVGKVNDVPVVTEAEFDRLTIQAQHAGTPFSQWKALKKLAHQELDGVLKELRNQIEGATADWPSMNQQGRVTRTQVTMEKLVRWVVGREEQYAGDRSATNDLLKDLRLDPPGKSEKKSQNREISSESGPLETL
jgi:hypothetical protein